MSLRLILMRHAKSDWAEAALPDHDRPLNDRGRRNADAMGAWLSLKGIRPAHALLSTARRVTETWDGLSAHLGDVEMTRHEDLYLAAPEKILDRVGSEESRDLIVIGHNPGMGALAQYLVATTPDRAEFHRFPTCATLILDIPGDTWTALGPACGRVEHFVIPQDLGR
ncbi:SixA phosphatase family protein [Palleronia sp. LCG004]|uniref:SixA phosphatase family protein n=1 Tax=Palleronia sp. LCG004 TaxID=3079304 RepID=UPI002943F1CD|nr:histidine phosphatase family protein [Palleronia sp. LCG004]WOI56539.1 histidine phosphatase family protein [Palleronia sp. LCG004]